MEETISQNESVRKAGVGMIMELYDEWYNEFLEEWDEVLQRCVIAAVKKGQKDKMKLELGVFNFSNENKKIKDLERRQYHQWRKM